MRFALIFRSLPLVRATNATVKKGMFQHLRYSEFSKHEIPRFLQDREKFEEKINHLKAGSYKCVAFILPLSFMIFWVLALFYFLGMAR